MKKLTALITFVALTSLLTALVFTIKCGTEEADPQAEEASKPLTEQEAQHLEWCDSIYHQNVGCPKHGEVEVPPEVLAEQEAQHAEWCKSIDYRNVGCQDLEG